MSKAIQRGIEMHDNRRRFEEWAREAIPNADLSGDWVRPGMWAYHDKAVELCWDAWCAGQMEGNYDS